MSLHPGPEPDGTAPPRRQLLLGGGILVGLVALVVAAAWLTSRQGAPRGHGDSEGGAAPAATPFGFPSPTATATSTETAAAPSGPMGGVGALGPGAPTAAWVTAENAKPGTRDWLLTKPSTHHEIEGFADHVSIDVGGAVNLFVSTTAPSFHVEAYRMGYYGGDQGRLVWTSATTPGVAQPAFSLAPGTNMVEDRWPATMSVQTDPASWPQGQYLLKLVASTGFQSYIPLTIRDDTSAAAYEVDSDVTTWQAYNLYGGYDLYTGPKGFASRSRVVSFDRPYTIGTGSGDFLGNELHVVSLVESLGLDVTYSTDVDLDLHPELVLAHRAFLSLGHDEYYSLAMRDGLQAARDRGVNLVFLGANAIYRHIRFEPSALGPDRHEIDYKDAREDPLSGKDNADVTPVAWRYPPNSKPESVIIGDYYQCNPVTADMVVSDAGSWIFAGAGVHDGMHLAGLVGTEYDHYDPNVPGPRNVTILARSPLVCQHHGDYADMTYYTAPSGAGVFATGTLNWVPKLDPGCAQPCPGAVVTRVTENILAAFGAGPAGAAHPSVANWATTPVPKVEVTPTASAPPAGPGGGTAEIHVKPAAVAERAPGKVRVSLGKRVPKMVRMRYTTRGLACRSLS